MVRGEEDQVAQDKPSHQSLSRAERHRRRREARMERWFAVAFLLGILLTAGYVLWRSPWISGGPGRL
jgi:hypothetical protein